jgi:hypothetical protein
VPSWHGNLSTEKAKRGKNIFSKKEQSMKKEIQTNTRFIVLLVFVIILTTSLFTACGDEEEQPKNHLSKLKK